MKVKITKTVKWSFDPSKSIEWFEKNKVYDLEEHKALRLLETGYALKETGCAIKTEQKMQQPVPENKAIDLTKVENKAFTGKKRGRKKKGE